MRLQQSLAARSLTLTTWIFVFVGGGDGRRNTAIKAGLVIDHIIALLKEIHLSKDNAGNKDNQIDKEVNKMIEHLFRSFRRPD